MLEIKTNLQIKYAIATKFTIVSWLRIMGGASHASITPAAQLNSHVRVLLKR
jgi:hypothetical protein